MCVTVPARGIRAWENSQKPRGSLGELCGRDLGHERGNDIISWQQNPTEPTTHVSRPPQRRGTPSQIACCQDVLLFAPAQRPGPQASSQAESVGRPSTLAQGLSESPLALCPKEQKGNRGAPGRVRPPLPSHPLKPEAFRCVWMGVSQAVSASSKPSHRWVWSPWTACVHTPGESTLGGMVSVQAEPCAQADLEPLAGGLHPPWWVSEQAFISVLSGNRRADRQKY